MKRLSTLLPVVLALAVLSVSQNLPAADPRRIPLSDSHQDGPSQLPKSGLELLQVAEQEAYRLEGAMRPWGLWQVARIYQATNRKKALQLLDAALAETTTIKDVPVPKMQEELTRSMSGVSAKSTKAWLQEQVARTVIMLDPGRAEELLQTSDVVNRGAILQALMSYYESHKLPARAIEQFYRIAAQDEAPYAAAIRIMASLKPEQSGELASMFSACLASYRDHAPHDFMPADEFPRLVMAYWQKIPRQLARDAVDEIIQQAQDSKGNNGFSMAFGTDGRSANSLLEYRLAQLMPALQELEGTRAKEYLEKFPAISGLADSFPASFGSATNNQRTSGSSFRVTGDSGNLLANMTELPLAQTAASKAVAGSTDEAMVNAATIVNPDLKVQVFEHIARTTSKQDAKAAASALAKMLTTIENVKLDRQPGYYASAADILITMGDLESAKGAIEKGLRSAAQLYKQDTDRDDPNTAFEAFWPSTNAYYMLLRKADRISEAWAIKLLKEIDSPEIMFAAETAIAGSALNVPESRQTIVTTKRSSFKMSLGPDSSENSRDTN